MFALNVSLPPTLFLTLPGTPLFLPSQRLVVSDRTPDSNVHLAENLLAMAPAPAGSLVPDSVRVDSPGHVEEVCGSRLLSFCACVYAACEYMHNVRAGTCICTRTTRTHTNKTHEGFYCGTLLMGARAIATRSRGGPLRVSSELTATFGQCKGASEQGGSACAIWVCLRVCNNRGHKLRQVRARQVRACMLACPHGCTIRSVFYLHMSQTCIRTYILNMYLYTRHACIILGSRCRQRRMRAEERQRGRGSHCQDAA